jgi:hypothetical protein
MSAPFRKRFSSDGAPFRAVLGPSMLETIDEQELDGANCTHMANSTDHHPAIKQR